MIDSYTVGPGKLVFGGVGDPGAQEAQITAATVEFEVDADDDTPVLSGEVDPGEETYPFSLKATLLQSLAATGLVAWSWGHKGEVTDFEYIPNLAKDRRITGEIKVRPINAGGEVKKKATSSVEFTGVGFPELSDVE